MERPDGRRTALVEADAAARTVEAAADSVGERMSPPPRKTEVGQLVVCDKGVVDVPKGAIITLVAEDKVVTREADGSSTVYHTDGRVERRDRPDRRQPESSGKDR